MKISPAPPPPLKERKRKRKRRTRGRKAKHRLRIMAPALPEDVIPGILVRVPPDDPACLVRASAACKAWRRILADPAFSARYRALHKSPPVLGFFRNPIDHKAPRFVPTASFRLPTADRPRRHLWDCRHGRVLLYDYAMRSPTQGFVVWDPITDDQHGINDVMDVYSNGAVVCTADGGCDHRSCSGGAFIVAFAGVESGLGFAGIRFLDAHTQFYSSATKKWSLHINIHLEYDKFELEEDRPAALVEDSLYFVCKKGFLLRYWFGPLLRLGYPGMRGAGIYTSELLTVIKPPAKRLKKVIVMTAEDGGLGLASLHHSKISLWAREASTDGGAGWVQSRTIDLKRMLPLSNPKRRPCLSGVIPENGNVIYVSTEDGVFTIELKPLQARKISEMGKDVNIIYPFVSFYAEKFLQRLASSKLPPPVETPTIWRINRSW